MMPLAEIGSANLPKGPTSAEEKGWVRYESDEGCRYVGSGWSKSSSIDMSNNDFYVTSNADDYIEFNFIDDSIRFIRYTTIFSPIVEISIDRIVDNQVDLYNSSNEHKYVAYENTSLSFGLHTIKIRNTGNKNASSSSTNFYIDAFEVHRPLYIEDIRTYRL